MPRCRGQPFKRCIPKRKQMTPSNPLCNFFPAISPFGTQFTLPAAPRLTRPWRPASAFASPLLSFSLLQKQRRRRLQATAAASCRLWEEEEEERAQREALPGLRPSLDRLCASRRVSSCKPFGRQAGLSVAQSSSSLRSFEPLPFYSSVLSFSPPAQAQLPFCGNTRAAFARCGVPG